VRRCRCCRCCCGGGGGGGGGVRFLYVCVRVAAEKRRRLVTISFRAVCDGAVSSSSAHACRCRQGWVQARRLGTSAPEHVARVNQRPLHTSCSSTASDASSIASYNASNPCCNRCLGRAARHCLPTPTRTHAALLLGGFVIRGRVVLGGPRRWVHCRSPPPPCFRSEVGVGLT
jgi:hypothetical protein